MKKLMDLLFLKETDNWFIQLFRYCFVGGLAFIVDYGLLVLLTEVCGLHYLISATIFRKSKLENKWAEFIVFAIIGVIGLGLNNLLLYLFTDIIHIHYMISKLITTGIVMIWNFGARKIILFTNK